MLQALLAGVASIKAQQTGMNVIGNNLANINTTSYKDQSVSFEAMVSQTLSAGSAPSSTLGGTNPEQLGLGVMVGSTSVNETQGSLDSTGVPSDLAIQGNGYFAVSNGSTVSYTRDGGFDVDASGELVQASTGQKLLGWQASGGSISTTSQLTPASTLTIPVGSATAVQATQNVTMAGNLDATSTATGTATAQVTVYDSLGVSHQVTIQFSSPASPPPATPAPPAGATASWQWTAYAGSDTTGAVLGSSTSAGNQPLFFDSNGSYVNPLAAGANDSITIPAANGASATTINMKFNSMSQLDESSSVNVSNQDGYAPGVLQSYSIGATGVVTGVFSNGMTQSLGQVALVTFANPNGLMNDGQNLYSASVDSGVPENTTPGTGSAGTVSAGYLEQSNVDIGTEFTNLIVDQRGFEANTKVITTVDQMLQDLNQMVQ